MESILKSLSTLFGDAFVQSGLDSSFGLVRVSDRPDLAQFQCNGAMAAAKAAGKSPRVIADQVIGILKDNPIFLKLEAVGPGFLNIVISDDFLADHLNIQRQSKSLGSPDIGQGRVIVLDYGGPNLAKPMHVGHLRASIIGDTLRRMYIEAGWKALGDVHMGDWGTQMGMIISELEITHPDWPYFNHDFEGTYPDISPVSMDDLEIIYPKAAADCKVDAARMERARAATVDLQNDRRGYRALWTHFRNVSIAGMKSNFDALNVHFDLWKGEADVHELIAPMVDGLRTKTLAVESEGALVVPVARDDDKREIPPLILYKRDGAVLYGTTDMATLVERMNLYNPSRIVYVVDQRQNLHFEQVFRATILASITPPEKVELHFAGFGTMNGVDGKPFKTRAGGIMKLEDLIAMGREKAFARLDEAELGKDFSADERADIAHKIAVAAIKFADLKNPRHVDYVFDLDKLTAFEGKTGPYLLYQAVRIKSLLAKADAQNSAILGTIIVGDVERNLVLTLLAWPETLAAALRDDTPHVVCEYAYRVAQDFSSFYGNCHILSETDSTLKNSRLALCALTVAMLEKTLGLLGIDIPVRM